MESERDNFNWLRYPQAESFILGLVRQLIQNLPAAASLASNLMTRTSSRLSDWMDHLVIADGDSIRGQLADLGFEREETLVAPNHAVFYHPGAVFPRILLRSDNSTLPGTPLVGAIQVENITQFLMTHQVTLPIEGTLLSPYRRARAWEANGYELWVVERRGHPGFIPTEMLHDYSHRYLEAFERWATRPRRFADIQTGMESTLNLAQSLASDMGTDTAAWIALAAERSYWQSRNWAGQIQKSRQDRMGMGWANHDHHTFRSSREVFSTLIRILETFGFQPRERFYAGAEAGWGAQVMEQPICRFAVFADVDMSPDEAEGDFAHQGLASRPGLGTVGLWCALHGESMLTAGLHHLAARFDFDAATTDLAEHGIQMMHPFSEFSYLQQAFTRGERWQVDATNLKNLIANGQITEAQRERFAAEGAVGSHLENIQRGEGFKGFNQHTVSDIIRRTDPRTEHRAD